MYVDSSGLNSPVEMETDGPLIEDVLMLKKTVEEEATQVNESFVYWSLLKSVAVTHLKAWQCRPWAEHWNQ